MYEYRHPNNGWKGITAPCDARHMSILMDWDVRSSPKVLPFSEYDLFTLVADCEAEKLYEIMSGELPDPDCLTTLFEVHELDQPDKSTFKVESKQLREFETRIFRTCPSSNPTGMKMPLETSIAKLWFLPVPKEVFGHDGIYVRIKVPKYLRL